MAIKFTRLALLNLYYPCLLQFCHGTFFIRGDIIMTHVIYIFANFNSWPLLQLQPVSIEYPYINIKTHWLLCMISWQYLKSLLF